MTDHTENQYKAFYRGKTALVRAVSSHQAQTIAAIMLRAKNKYEITVMLIEKDGKPYTHSTSGL